MNNKLYIRIITLALLSACTQNNAPQSQTDPVASASVPSQANSPSPSKKPEQAVIPIPTPTPSSSVDTPFPEPVQTNPPVLLTQPESAPITFYEGDLVESFLGINYSPIGVLNDSGNGMITWPGGESLALIKNYAFDTLAPADFRYDFGRAKASLNESGDGILAWNSTPITGVGVERNISTSFQSFKKYKPVGTVKRLADYEFVDIEAENSESGALFANKKGDFERVLHAFPIRAGDIDSDTGLPKATLPFTGNVIYGSLSEQEQAEDVDYVLYGVTGQRKRLKLVRFAKGELQKEVIKQETTGIWTNHDKEGGIVWASEDGIFRVVIVKGTDFGAAQEIAVPESLKEAGPRFSRFAINPGGEGFMVWKAGNKILAAKVENTTVTPGVVIAEGVSNMSHLSVFVNASGDGVVWWVRIPQAALDELYENRGTPRDNSNIEHVVSGRFIRNYQFQ